MDDNNINNNAPESLFYSSSSDATANKINNVDHFIIDDLLDFPDDASPGISSPPLDTSSNSSSLLNFHTPDLAAHFSTDQFCVPYDDLAELEWLSNFEEGESFSSDDLQKLHLIQGITARPDIAATRTCPMLRPEVSVPAKARSKRSRAAPGNWASRLLAVAAPTPQMKREVGPESPGEGRRCLHCATDKTPQWRTGPMGPKTLCNACGVRFKSGRLVPEYRPASSPTFVLTKHSNSHRKVLELRRQKESSTSSTKAQQHHQFMSHHHHHHHHHQNNNMQQVFDVSNGEDYLIHQHIGPAYLI